MHDGDIKIGKKYWVRTRLEASPQPVRVLQKFQTTRPCCQCVDASGESLIVFPDAFVRPVEPEPLRALSDSDCLAATPSGTEAANRAAGGFLMAAVSCATCPLPALVVPAEGYAVEPVIARSTA